METCFKNLGFLSISQSQSHLDSRSYLLSLSIPIYLSLSSPARDANLLLQAFGPRQNFNLFLGSHECSLVIILLVLTSKNVLGVRSLRLVSRLLLQRSIVGVVKACLWNLKLCSVPLLERRDELLLDRIDLALPFSIFSLGVLKRVEMVTVDFLKVFHFAEHDELFFVDNLFRLFLEHVFLAELLVALTDLAFFLFAVKARFQGIDFALVFVQSICDAFNFSTAFFETITALSDALLESLALFRLFEFDKCLLLVNRLAFLLNLFFELLLAFFISFSIFTRLFSFAFRGSRLFGFFSSCTICRS